MNLKIDNISFRYKRRAPMVLEDFNLELSQGGICGLLGPNGVGKSTLLYLIAGALTPMHGKVYFNGIDTRRRLPLTLSEIYLVPEEVVLPKCSLDEYVGRLAPLYTRFNKDVLDESLSEFNFIPTGNIDSLSMGQKKKIALSFAFSVNAGVLLMDEPTNGLDIPGKAAFRTLCARYASDESAFIISTHQVRDIDQLLDHLVIMNTRRTLLNAAVCDVQRSLKFISGYGDVPADALYAANSIGGYNAILPNIDGDDTEINLESLFDFAMGNPDKIETIFANAAH